MSAPVFFSQELDTSDGAVIVLGAEARHAHVMRLTEGTRVDVVDGRGRRVVGAVADCGRDRLAVTVLEMQREPEPQPSVCVVQAIPKDGELAVDLLTEVGVDRIVPWASERSVERWRGDRAVKAHGRWVSAMQAAAKQSRRAHWPVIDEQTDLEGVRRLVADATQALLMDQDAERSAADVPLPATGQVVVIVGPEGGLTDAEAEVLTGAGAVPVRLGPGVLRSAVAGAVAVAALSAPSPRWASRGRIRA